MGIPTGFPTIAPFATSEFRTTTEYMGENLGQFYCDGSGSIFMIVDCQEAFVEGEVCVINYLYQATQGGTSSRGWVGVIKSTPTASDTYAWAQVFGTASAWAAVAATTVGTLILPVTTDGGYFGVATSAYGNSVWGALLVGAPSTAAADPTGWTTGVVGYATVQLNWPFVNSSGDFSTS